MSTFKTASTASGDQQRLVLRLGLWAGFIGPLFFMLVSTIDGFFTPGYSGMRDVVSFLELGPTGWIQSLNFIITGLLFVFFAFGFFQWMRSRSALGWLIVTSVLIALSGVGLVMAGFFLPDAPGSIQTSSHGLVHAITFSLIFLSLGIACPCVGGKFLRTAGWRIYAVYSLLAGLFSIVTALGNLYSSFIISIVSMTPLTSKTSQIAFGVIINNILIIVVFDCYLILSQRLLAQEKEVVNAPQL